MKDFNGKIKKISRDELPNKEQIRRNVKSGATVVMTESKEKKHPILGTMLTAAASLLLIVGLIAGGTLVQRLRKPGVTGSDAVSDVLPDSEIRLTGTGYDTEIDPPEQENIYFLYNGLTYEKDNNGISVKDMLACISYGKFTVSDGVDPELVTEDLVNVTPDGLYERTGCSLYLSEKSFTTLVLSAHGTLYHLAGHIGSYGLTGVVPAVFELGEEYFSSQIGFFFNYTWGSGVDGRTLAYFDRNTGKVTEIVSAINGDYKTADGQSLNVEFCGFGLAVQVARDGERNRYFLCNYTKTEIDEYSSWDGFEIIGELVYDADTHSVSLILEDDGAITPEKEENAYPIFEKALVSKLQTREELLDLLNSGEKIVAPHYSENSETLDGIFFFGYFSENKEFGICYYDLSSDTVTTIGRGKDGKYHFPDGDTGYYATVRLHNPTIVLAKENGVTEYRLCERSLFEDGTTYHYLKIGSLEQDEDGTWFLPIANIDTGYIEAYTPVSDTTIREDTVTEPFDTEPSSTDSFESEFSVTTDSPETELPETEPVTEPTEEPEEPWTDPALDASAEYAQGEPGFPINDKYQYYGEQFFEVKYSDQGVEKTGTAYLCVGGANSLDGTKHEEIYVTYFAVFAEDGSLVFARKWYGAGMMLANSDTPDSIMIVLKNANNDRQGWAFYGVYILDAAGPILSETCAYARVSNVDGYNGDTIGEYQKISGLASNLLDVIGTEYGIILDNLGGTLFLSGEISRIPSDRYPVSASDKTVIRDISSPASRIDEYLSMY